MIKNRIKVPLDLSMIDVTFNVNLINTNDSMKGVTFCDIHVDNNRIATGSAFCGSDDTFGMKKGAQTALKRALEQASTYFDIPKEQREAIWLGFNACEIPD